MAELKHMDKSRSRWLVRVALNLPHSIQPRRLKKTRFGLWPHHYSNPTKFTQNYSNGGAGGGGALSSISLPIERAPLLSNSLHTIFLTFEFFLLYHCINLFCTLSYFLVGLLVIIKLYVVELLIYELNQTEPN